MKRFLILCLVTFALIVGGFVLRGASQSVQPGIPNVTALFQPIRSRLENSPIPLRLPTYIPQLSSEPGYTPPPIHAVLDESSTKQYTIILGYSPDCTGGNACRLGTITGELKPSQSIEQQFAEFRHWSGEHHSEESMAPVQLSNGINGWFIPWVCGANCSDAQVVWDEYSYRYSVGIKVGDRASLERMANSAIEAAQR
jgi:hypothetical protein